MSDRARAALEAALAPRGFRAAHLAAGRTGEVLRVEVDGGSTLVAKLDPRGDGGLETEADGLRMLAAAGAPAPRVESAGPHLLLMDWCPGDTGVASDAADDAARALHRLHAAGERPFGLASDARIGGLHQPNAPEDSWLVFFAEHRLLAFARAARDEGELDDVVLSADHLAHPVAGAGEERGGRGDGRIGRGVGGHPAQPPARVPSVTIS